RRRSSSTWMTSGSITTWVTSWLTRRTRRGPGTRSAISWRRWPSARAARGYTSTSASPCAGGGAARRRRPLPPGPRPRPEALSGPRHPRHRLAAAGPAERARLRLGLHPWQGDPALTGVRDAGPLATLPPAERAAWQQLWADVAATVARARETK